MINKLGILIVAVLIAISGGHLRAQNKDMKSFTLKEAQEYAVKNGYNMRNAKIDLDIAKKTIWEYTAIGLPQISASMSYQDMLDVPTTLLPDFITPAIVGVNKNLFGLTNIKPIPETQYFPAKFGTAHNLTLGATLSQLIFSGSYIVGLQATRAFYDISKQTAVKTDQETRQSVTQSYYQVLVLQETRKILAEQVSNLEKLSFESEEFYKNGLVDDVLVDQMKLNLLNVKNAVASLDRNIEVSQKLFNLQLGVDVNEKITLKDNLNDLLTQLQPALIENGQFKVDKHIDYVLFETQEKIQYLNLKKEKANYLPTLSAFYTYKSNAMRNEFDFTDSKGLWYPTSIIGVNLDVPIFSSGSKHFKVQQAKLKLDKMKVSKEMLSQSLILGAESARLSFNNSFDSYQKELENKKLTENIYNKTLAKFKEGMATSTELVTNQTQYLSSLSSYYNSIFTLLNSKNNYDKAINNY